MITIFSRELRENLKWAAMIALAFFALIFLRAWHASPFFLLDLPDPMTLIYAPLAGLVMGVAQSAFETRPDNWSFVVHRPVARPAIFAAKCAAGLLLLYATLGIPCAAAVAWAARPGNLPAPFRAETTLPMLADVLTAGCYYFLGILLTLRRARWLGTRLLPIGLAFACTTFVRLAPGFWQACAAIALTQCAAAAAAWGAFATAGEDNQGPVARFALGAMIFAGAQTIALFLGGILGVFETTVRWHSTRLDLEGNVLRIDKTFEDDELSYAITDLSGKPVPQFDNLNTDDPANADRFTTFAGAMGDDRLLPWPLSAMSGNSYRTARKTLRPLRNVAPPGTRLAFLPIYDASRRAIDLYDPITCLLVGRVTPGGFTPGTVEPAADAFPAELLNGPAQGGTRTLAFPSAVYWMELDHRRVRKVFDAPPDDPVVAAHELPPAANPTIAVVTRARLRLLDVSGHSTFSIPLAVDLQRCLLRVAILPANRHIILSAEALSPEFEHAITPVYLEYSPDGNLVRRTEAPDLDEAGAVKQARTAAFGAAFPPAALPLHRPWLADTYFDVDTDQHPRLFLRPMIVASLLSAILASLLCRRYRMTPSSSFAWTAAALLLGPAALAVLTGLHEVPAPESRQSARPPAPDGREIFEPVGAFPSPA